MNERVILTADEGMVLTDGVNYGRTIYLAEGDDPATYYQITESEYEAILEREQDESDPNRASIEDYRVALARLGVE